MSDSGRAVSLSNVKNLENASEGLTRWGVTLGLAWGLYLSCPIGKIWCTSDMKNWVNNEQIYKKNLGNINIQKKLIQSP